MSCEGSSSGLECPIWSEGRGLTPPTNSLAPPTTARRRGLTPAAGDTGQARPYFKPTQYKCPRVRITIRPSAIAGVPTIGSPISFFDRISSLPELFSTTM